MDFLSSLAKGGDQPKSTSDQPNKPDLFASAKVVADAAQAQFRNEPEKYDKNKVAGAAADILDATSEYGKLDETKGAGKYIDQAETYLRQFNTSDPSAAAEHKPATEGAAPAADAAPAAAADEKTAPAEGSAESEKPSGGKPESGYGGLMKMAGGFLNK